MLKFALIFLFCISLYSKDIAASAQLPDHKENKFPHRMWMFWDTNIEKAPIFIQLCVNNLRHFAEVSGWELILLSNENIFNYLSPETSEKLRDMKSKIGKVSPTALSDLHRIFVMYENGGMWIDISSVMVRDLSWV
jgi:mannosyltransferase OCH1-like enzyme